MPSPNPNKVRFIYNPSAGTQGIAEYVDAIAALYADRGYTLEAQPVNFSPDKADLLIEGLDQSYSHILIAGGDGTINYVVNLLKKHNIDIPIGVLSMGTANDFSSLLRMPHHPMDACRAILEGNVRSIDIGSVNGHYFVNVFSCGLFTDVSQKTPTFFKNNFGKISYYFSGLTDLPKFRKMDLTIRTDGGDFEGKALIFFVFNGRTAGTLPIAYLSEVDDGKLDVLILRGDTPQETLATAINYLPFLRHKDKYPAGITHIRCSRLVAHSPRNENTDVDGQPGPAFPIDITCHPAGLRVIVPREEDLH